MTSCLKFFPKLDVVMAVLPPDEFETYGGPEKTISTRRDTRDKTRERPFSTSQEEWFRKYDPWTHLKRWRSLLFLPMKALPKTQS